MRNFNRNNRSGGGFNRGDRGRPDMHNAVCDNCGKDCEVPFKPTGDKPIYCSDCFKKIDPQKAGSRSSQRSGFGDKQMHKAICDKCKKECEVPFRPSGGKPVFCDNCFVKEDKGGSRGSGQSNEQLAQINAKLDEILKALSGTTKEKPVKKVAPDKEDKPKKPAAKKKVAKKKTTKKK